MSSCIAKESSVSAGPGVVFDGPLLGAGRGLGLLSVSSRLYCGVGFMLRKVSHLLRREAYTACCIPRFPQFCYNIVQVCITKKARCGNVAFMANMAGNLAGPDGRC